MAWSMLIIGNQERHGVDMITQTANTLVLSWYDNNHRTSLIIEIIYFDL